MQRNIQNNKVNAKFVRPKGAFYVNDCAANDLKHWYSFLIQISQMNQHVQSNYQLSKLSVQQRFKRQNLVHIMYI